MTTHPIRDFFFRPSSSYAFVLFAFSFGSLSEKYDFGFWQFFLWSLPFYWLDSYISKRLGYRP